MTAEEARRLVNSLVGPLRPAEAACFFGRQSKLRRWAEARGVANLLPPPPPLDQDPTMPGFIDPDTGVERKPAGLERKRQRRLFRALQQEAMAPPSRSNQG